MTWKVWQNNVLNQWLTYFSQCLPEYFTHSVNQYMLVYCNCVTALQSCSHPKQNKSCVCCSLGTVVWYGIWVYIYPYLQTQSVPVTDKGGLQCAEKRSSLLCFFSSLLCFLPLTSKPCNKFYFMEKNCDDMKSVAEQCDDIGILVSWLTTVVTRMVLILRAKSYNSYCNPLFKNKMPLKRHESSPKKSSGPNCQRLFVSIPQLENPQGYPLLSNGFPLHKTVRPATPSAALQLPGFLYWSLSRHEDYYHWK